MRKGLVGIAKIGLVFTSIIVFIFSFAFYLVPVFAPAGNVTLNASNYYTNSTALVTVNDSDEASNGQITIIVNTTTDAGFSLTLNESGSSGVFNNTFNFTTTGSSNAATHTLRVNDGDTIVIWYNDSNPLGWINTTAFFNFTVNANISFNTSVYGTLHMAGITVNNNDTGANKNGAALDTIFVSATSSTNTTGINVTLTETGANTGVFSGNLTFNTTGNNDTNDVLHVSAGDIVTVLYNDTFDTYGNFLNATDTARVATTASLLFNLGTFYPGNTGIVNVSDNDSNSNTSLYDTVWVRINNTGASGTINVTLNETGVDTGLFNGSFTFVFGASNDGTDQLGFNNTCRQSPFCNVFVFYNDTTNMTGSLVNVSNSSAFQLTENGSISLNSATYGSSSTAIITVTDDDAQTNPDIGTVNQIIVAVQSPSNTSGISVTLTETGVNTGVFNGTFTFSTTTHNDSTDTLLVSDNDTITANYTDSRNWTGGSIVINDTAIFLASVTAVIDFNATRLNATETAFFINTTASVNVTDNDPFTNNASVIDTINLTISNSLCSITITLNESGINTGIFNVSNTFNFSSTICSNTTRTLKVNTVAHQQFNFTYIDPKNGTVNDNVSIVNTTIVDSKKPVFSLIVITDPDNVYLPGQEININVTLDQPGGTLSGNFSAVDNWWVPGAETVVEVGAGSYRINYTINSSSNVTEGPSKTITMTANDSVGNGPTQGSIDVILSRIDINTTLLNFSTLTPGGMAVVPFTIINTGNVSQSSINEFYTIYRQENFSFTTSADETRIFYFMVRANSSKVIFNVTSNESTVKLNSKISDHSTLAILSTDLDGTITSSISPATTRIWKWEVTTSNASGPVIVEPLVSVYFDTNGWFNSTLDDNDNRFNASTNTTLSLNITLPQAVLLPWRLNGTAKFNNTNTSITTGITLNISSPMMWIESNTSSPLTELPNGNLTLDVNLNREVRQMFITINNTGDVVLTGVTANLTSNFTKSGGVINVASVNCGAGVSGCPTPQSINFGNISNNSFKWIALTFNVSNASGGVGSYDTLFKINTTNGQPYSASNVTLRINLTTELNVTIFNTTYQNTIDTNPSPGENITINLTVNYLTGEAITDLLKANFTVFDLNSNINPTATIHGFNDSRNSSGIYWFNITVPPITAGVTEPGIHNIHVQARDRADGNSGNGSTTFNLTAAKFDVIPPSDFSMSNGTQTTKTFTIENEGNINATFVNVNVSVNASGLTVTGDTIINISNSSSRNVQYTFNTTSSASGAFSVTVNASMGQIWDQGSVVVRVSGGGSGSDNPGGGNPDSSPDDNANQVSSLEIEDYVPSFRILLGGKNSSTVTVKNTGNVSLLALLDVSIDGISHVLNISDCALASSQKCVFGINFTVSNDTDIGDHVGIYTASKDGDSSIKDTKTFTITVVPTEEKKQEIDIEYQNYVTMIENLSSQLDFIKSIGFVSEENLSRAEILLNDSNNLLADIQAAIDADDYITADILLKELNSTINRLNDALDVLREEQRFATKDFLSIYGIWIAIGIVIVAAAVLIYYTLLPQKGGYHVKYGYKAKKRGALSKFGLRKKSAKEKFVPETKLQNFEKIPQRYEYKKSAGEKIKSLFKRKKKDQRYLSEFGHAS